MEPFAWQRAASPSEAVSVATHTTAEAMLTLTGKPDTAQSALIKAAGWTCWIS